jgi:hypothetical protein
VLHGVLHRLLRDVKQRGGYLGIELQAMAFTSTLPAKRWRIRLANRSRAGRRPARPTVSGVQLVAVLEHLLHQGFEHFLNFCDPRADLGRKVSRSMRIKSSCRPKAVRFWPTESWRNCEAILCSNSWTFKALTTVWCSSSTAVLPGVLSRAMPPRWLTRPLRRIGNNVTSQGSVACAWQRT